MPSYLGQRRGRGRAVNAQSVLAQPSFLSKLQSGSCGAFWATFVSPGREERTSGGGEVRSLSCAFSRTGRKDHVRRQGPASARPPARLRPASLRPPPPGAPHPRAPKPGKPGALTPRQNPSRQPLPQLCHTHITLDSHCITRVHRTHTAYHLH